MLKLKLITLLVISEIYGQALAYCPEAQHLKPCKCEDGYIRCDDVTGSKLKEIFTKIYNDANQDHRHYHRLQISGDAITQIPEYVFHDISFDEIIIKDTPKLKRIHEMAFKGTYLITKRLNLNNIPGLETGNLFEILNKFKQISAFKLCDLDDLEQVPANAFGKLHKLKEIYFCGQRLKRVGEKAFYKLNSLNRLDFVNTGLTKINQITFEHESHHVLYIGLYNNRQLNGMSFTAQTFSHTRRPTTLDFSGYHFQDVHYRKQITFLDDDVFRAFFKANELNDVNLYGLEFNCENCKNLWLKKDTELHERLRGLRCATKSPKLTDPEHFKACH